MNDFPCFYILYFANQSCRIEIFLKLAKATRLNLTELHERFDILRKSGIEFNSNSINSETLNKYYNNEPYGICHELFESIAEPLNIKDFNPCKICPYSHSYANKNRNNEASVFKYLLSHPDAGIWNVKNPKTFFRSNHLLILKEADRTRIITLQLFYRLFLSANKNIAGKLKPGNIILEDILERLKSQLILSSFRGTGISPDIIMQAVAKILIFEFEKSETITDEKQYYEVTAKIKKRYTYRPRSFLPDEMKQFQFNDSRGYVVIPDSLGSIRPSASDECYKVVTPSSPVSSDRVFNLHEIAKIASGQLQIHKSESSQKYSTVHTDIIVPPFTPEPKTSQAANIFDETSPETTSATLLNINVAESDSTIAAPAIEVEPANNVQQYSSIFDESGIINISNEVSRFLVITLHPHDIYTFLTIIRKEEWIGAERAADRDDGILILCGSGKAVFFLPRDVLNTDILKCIFCRDWVTVISMNATPIFSFLIEQETYIFPNIISLSARYNAYYKLETLNPIAALYELIGSSAIPFIFSETIRLLQNYGQFCLALGQLVERTNRYRIEKNYLFYEYALGTAMNIGRKGQIDSRNFKRLGYFDNVFSFDGKPRRLINQTICTFYFSLTAKGDSGHQLYQRNFIVYSLAYIYKNSTLWRYQPVLLFYNFDCLTLRFNATREESLGHIEETISRILVKNCKKLNLNPPVIHITYHQ